MNTEESKKVEKEVSITRRAAIKAGWAVPIILAIGLGGNTFVHATGQNDFGTNQGNSGGVPGGSGGPHFGKGPF